MWKNTVFVRFHRKKEIHFHVIYLELKEVAEQGIDVVLLVLKHERFQFFFTIHLKLTVHAIVFNCHWAKFATGLMHTHLVISSYEIFK